MAESKPNISFTADVSQAYARYMAPLFFAPYAEEMAARAAALRPTRMLELAAGTGAATRALARMLPAGTEIVATDLNQGMLDQAMQAGTARPVTWRQADAQSLPFPDASFDLVLCQFGVMFVPDKARTYAEVRRVLQPGGTFLFTAWDRTAENPLHRIVRGFVAEWLTGSPDGIPPSASHSYHDREVIERDLRAGGFTERAEFTALRLRSKAASPTDVALALCQGSPTRNEIETRRPGALAEATAAAAEALARQIGPGPVDQPMQAHVVRVTKSP